MRFRHLDYPDDCVVDQLGPAAIDAILDRGDLEAWRPLRDAVRDEPFGVVADTILRLCAAHPMYGTSAIWTTWIERLRAEVPVGLAELRRRRGLTQTDVARRTGSTQSDVSKLERRSDVRLSSLASYAAAIGGSLDLRVRFAVDGSIPIMLAQEDVIRGDVDDAHRWTWSWTPERFELNETE